MENFTAPLAPSKRAQTEPNQGGENIYYWMEYFAQKEAFHCNKVKVKNYSYLFLLFSSYLFLLIQLKNMKTTYTRTYSSSTSYLTSMVDRTEAKVSSPTRYTVGGRESKKTGRSDRAISIKERRKILRRKTNINFGEKCSLISNASDEKIITFRVSRVK